MNNTYRIDIKSKYDDGMEIIDNIILYKNDKNNNIIFFYKNIYSRYLEILENKIKNIDNNKLYNNEYLKNTCLPLKIRDYFFFSTIKKYKLQEFYIKIINFKLKIELESLNEYDYNEYMNRIINNEYNSTNGSIDVTDLSLTLDDSFYDFLMSFLNKLPDENKKNFIKNLFYNYSENDEINYDNYYRKITSISLNSRIKYINNYINNQKKNIDNIFTFTNQKFDNKKIYNLFNELEKFYHLIISYKKINDSIINDNINNLYIFPYYYNNIPYNTYLYALFNNIYLINYNITDSNIINIPKSEHLFIGMTTIDKELKNTINLKSKIEKYDINNLKNIYINILNNLYRINVKQKEFFILFFWINIYRNLYDSINSLFFFTETIIEIFNGYILFFSKYDSHVHYFYNEIKKFYNYININKNSYNKFKQKNNNFMNNSFINENKNLFDDNFLGYVYYAIHNIKFCFRE